MNSIIKLIKSDPKWSLSILFTALLSFALTFYSVKTTERKCIPVFFVEPVRMQLLDRSQTTEAPFKVIKKDGTEIEDNIILARFYFYNYGKKTLHIEDVASDLRISIKNDSCEILDYKVLLQSEPEVVEANLNLTEERGKDELIINFLAIEKGDGFTGQIIYSGKIDDKISIRGKIIDSEDIVTNETISELRPFWWKIVVLFTVTIFICLILFIICLIIFSQFEYRNWTSKFNSVVEYCMEKKNYNDNDYHNVPFFPCLNSNNIREKSFRQEKLNPNRST